jgi:hypothetical protein
VCITLDADDSVESRTLYFTSATHALAHSIRRLTLACYSEIGQRDRGNGHTNVDSIR